MAAVRLPAVPSVSQLSRSVSTIPIILSTRNGSSFSPSSLLSASISIPAISITIPGILSDIWEGILRAVPKKKTSHMKKRHRQLAGKALKDVNAVVKCSACGRPKKSHTLCPFCVAEIKDSWKPAAQKAAKAAEKNAAKEGLK